MVRKAGRYRLWLHVPLGSLVFTCQLAMLPLHWRGGESAAVMRTVKKHPDQSAAYRQVTSLCGASLCKCTLPNASQKAGQAVAHMRITTPTWHRGQAHREGRARGQVLSIENQTSRELTLHLLESAS